MSKPVRVAILGFGSRGRLFADLVHQAPDLATVVAVAEPRAEARAEAARCFGLEAAQLFESWQSFAAEPRPCDAVVVATMDRDHARPAVACLGLGYHLLLEKPMGVTLDECRAIEAAQRRAGTLVSVCHSLRYNKGFAKVKELLEAGAIGRLVSLDQLEQVGYYHYAHSYVRGNWHREADSSFMLLAKSCHDLDFMSYLVGKPVQRVSSFGSLSHFKPENAPAGATPRCTDGCAAEARCPFSAVRLYAHGKMNDWLPSPVADGVNGALAARFEALRTGPYGLCVYHGRNDVVDHQVVALEYEGGVTGTFTMTGFTHRIARRIRLHGTDGELEFEEHGSYPGDRVVIKRWLGDTVENIHVPPEPGSHGGGDARVVRSWLLAIRRRDPALVLTSAQESLATHTVVFAAEAARKSGMVQQLADWYGVDDDGPVRLAV